LALCALGCSKDSTGGGSGSGSSSAGTNAGSGSNGASNGSSSNGTGSSGSSGSNAGSGSSSSGGNGSGGTTSTGLDAGRAAYCAGAGAPINVGDSSADAGASATCAGNLAQRTFRFALCTCDALTVNQHLNVDSFARVDAGYGDGGLLRVSGRHNGSVGVDNGIVTSASNAQLNVGGSLFVSDGGVTAAGAISVDGELHLGSDGLATAGSSVGRDAFCAGNLTGTWTVDGNLYQPAAGTHVGVTVNGSQGVVASNVTVDDPCDCTNLVDIAGIVASHQADNDDAFLPPPVDGGTTVQFGDGGEGLLLVDGGFQQIALDPAAWASGAGPTSYTWPCGRYYLSGVHITSGTTWNISGRTALLIDGDFDVSGGGIIINVPPGSELDLFIAGNLSVGATSTFGSASNVAGTRIYVGGSDPIVLTTPVTFHANIYAPFAIFETTNPTTINGALFVKQFLNNPGGGSQGGNVTIHYDEDVLSAGSECVTPTIDAGFLDDGGIVDAGAPVDAGPQGCQTCGDCNNQACNIPDGGTAGTCGGCTTSADCCAPLVCTNGSCQVLFQ